MRNHNLLALLATAAVAAVAMPAAAANVTQVSLSNEGQPTALPAGQVLIADFNDAMNPTATLVNGVSLALNGATVGWHEGDGGYSGTLPGNTTHYLTVSGGTTATFTSDSLMSSFSLYMGSPDTYNWIQFIGDGFNETFSGADMFLGDTNQAWSWGKRVNFDFGGYKVNQVVLSATGNSFEVDNAAGSFQAAVPEPATWAMMIMGFGAVGAVVRRRRTVSTFA